MYLITPLNDEDGVIVRVVVGLAQANVSTSHQSHWSLQVLLAHPSEKVSVHSVHHEIFNAILQ